MIVYSPTAIRDLNGLKLDCLSQPVYSQGNKVVTFRAESGTFVLHFLWSVVNPLIDPTIKFAFGVGCSEREQNSKDCVIVAGFEAADDVKTFVAAARKLGIIIPADWICLTELS